MAMNEEAAFHPLTAIFPEMDEGQFSALREDIERNGLLEPIWRLGDGRIIDGRHRFKACEELGVTPRYETLEDESEALATVVSLNLKRRHLNESQRAMVAARLKPLYEEAARERNAEGGRKKGQANLPEAEKGQARDFAAEATRVSPRSVESASRVIQRGTPELIAAVEQGDVAVSFAAALAKKSDEEQREVVKRVYAGDKPTEAQRAQRQAAMRERIASLPEGQHRVIYADPPWQYNDARAFEGYSATAAEDHYPTMSVEELCDLDVASLAADDCVLFCWATFPLLLDALTVVKAWGFKYKTAFVWHKERPNFGHYHNATAELLLVCTRGSATPDAGTREDQVQIVERTGRHSAKPQHFRELIDRQYQHGPRIELFARGVLPKGWVGWGNEAT